MPVARPTSATLMKMIAIAVRYFRNGATPRNSFATTVSTSLKIVSGMSPIQNFDHKNCFNEIGDVRMIQNACPSADTAGNTNRTAMVAITKLARPRFRNA